MSLIRRGKGLVSLAKQELLIWRKAVVGTRAFIRGHKVCHLLLGIHHFTNYLKNERNFPGKEFRGRLGGLSETSNWSMTGSPMAALNQ